MVRSRKGIEMLVNLINIAYCAMKLLPYQDEALQSTVMKEYRISGLRLVSRFGRKYFCHFRVKEREHDKIICSYERLEIPCSAKGLSFIKVVNWCIFNLSGNI